VRNWQKLAGLDPWLLAQLAAPHEIILTLEAHGARKRLQINLSVVTRAKDG
jgi:hypothetical protein